MNIKSSLSTTVASLLVAGVALLSANEVKAVSIDYSNTVGSSISFAGDGTFSFTPALDNFKVTSGSASGFLGDITGTYTIGAITTLGPLSMAPITGTGALVIDDPSGFDLTATLTWVDIQQLGTGGSLNVLGSVNLTGITYSGSNPDLLALAAAGSAIDVLSFQFNPALSLATLKGSPNQTSFSGSIATVPDGGATIGLFGFALLGIGVIGRKIKSATA
jgi:VPDSG-CTERM motif